MLTSAPLDFSAKIIWIWQSWKNSVKLIQMIYNMKFKIAKHQFIFKF